MKPNAKQVTAKAGCESVHYGVETRRLTVIWKDGSAETFDGVMPEVFYGMPTGSSLINFIDLKLRGRYVVHKAQKPPAVFALPITGILQVELNGVEFEYSLPRDLLMSCPSDPLGAYEFFKQHAAHLEPTRSRGPNNETDAHLRVPGV